MAKVKFKWDNAGFRALMQSGEMQSILKDKADEAAAKAGDGVIVQVKVGQKRAYADIVADSFPARVRNNRDNTLLKAIGH